MLNFLNIEDCPDPKVWVSEAIELKKFPYRHSTLGENLVLGLLFMNPSLRTRLSTLRAAHLLGMHTVDMDMASGWPLEFLEGSIMEHHRSEHIREAAGVVSRYCDIIGIRCFPGLEDRDLDYSEPFFTAFLKHSTSPVVNLESSTRHPLQAFADVMTIEEHKRSDKPKVVLTWAPHPKSLPQSVPNSFISWAKLMHYELVITHPEGYELDPKITDDISIEYDSQKAFMNADFVYAKNWSSYQEYGKILNKDPDWMVTDKKMKGTNSAKFMHCLPVRRNVVVADDVLDGPDSVVLTQAENRVYTAQVVLKHIIEHIRT
jgi:N-succinyl-L-ornithine transcarbamylase